MASEAIATLSSRSQWGWVQLTILFVPVVQFAPLLDIPIHVQRRLLKNNSLKMNDRNKTRDKQQYTQTLQSRRTDR